MENGIGVRGDFIPYRRKGKGNMEEQKKKRSGNAMWCVRLVVLLISYFFVLFCITWMATGNLNDGALSRYMDPNAVVMLLLIVFLTMLFSGNGKRFLNGWGAALGRNRYCSLTELRRYLEAMQLARRAAFLAGGIVALICAVNVLYFMTTLIAIGFVLGNSLLTFYYAVAFALIQQPMEARLQEWIVDYMDEGVDEEPVEDAQTMYFRLRGMGLTDREAEVARLVARELSNKEIGKELYISDATVKKHITHILEKTGCDSRESLAELVHRKG